MANRYPKVLTDGTKVRIKSVEELIIAGNRSFNPRVMPSMLGLSGRIAYIDKCIYTKHKVRRYQLTIEGPSYLWTDHMFDVLPAHKLDDKFKGL